MPIMTPPLTINFTLSCLSMKPHLILVALLLTISLAKAGVFFTETFDGGVAGWIQNPTVTTTASPHSGTSGLSFNLSNTASLAKLVSTVGYANVVLTGNIAASSLESGLSNDRCHLEFSTDRGLTFVSVVSLIDPQNNSVFNAITYSLPSYPCGELPQLYD